MNPPRAPFEVEFSFTFEEWREGVLEATRKERRTRFIWAFIGSAGLIAGAFAPLLDEKPIYQTQLTIGLLLLALTVFNLIEGELRIRRDWRRTVRDDLLTMRFAPDRWIIDDTGERTEIPWHAVSHFTETARLFLIHQRSGRVRIIPKRILGDDARVGEFRAFLLDRIGRTSEAAPPGFAVKPVSMPAPESRGSNQL